MAKLVQKLDVYISTGKPLNEEQQPIFKKNKIYNRENDKVGEVENLDSVVRYQENTER